MFDRENGTVFPREALRILESLDLDKEISQKISKKILSVLAAANWCRERHFTVFSDWAIASDRKSPARLSPLIRLG